MNRTLLCLTILLASASCATAPLGPEGPPLPFHIAVLPTETLVLLPEARRARAEEGGAALDSGETPETGAPRTNGVATKGTVIEAGTTRAVTATNAAPEFAGFGLTLTPTSVAERIAQVLDHAYFTRATVLAYPDGVDAAEFATWSREEQSAHWVAAALDVHADLVLRGVVHYSPLTETSINSSFWGSLSILLLGIGPATWVIDDRDYALDVSFDASIYDLSTALEPGALLEDSSLRLARSHHRLGKTSMDLLDRAEGDAGTFLLSFVIPAGFLAKESDQTERALSTKVSEGLAHTFGREMQARADELIAADHLFDFRPEDVIVRRGPEGFELSGDFVLDLGSVEALGGFSLRAGDVHLSEASFGRGLAEEGEGRHFRSLRYPLSLSLPAATEADTVQIEVWDGSRDQNRRTFTFPISEPPTRR